jgi:hypothetical protein
MDNDRAAIYFCDIDGGSARLTALDIDLYGNIKNWPRDFFGDELSDIAATTKAARERRDAQEA